MKNKRSKQIIALIALLSLGSAGLTGCVNMYNTPVAIDTSSVVSTADSEEAEETPITATSVKYSKDGRYTTTVSSDKIDLSGITKENTEVTCIVFNSPEVLYYEEDEEEISEMGLNNFDEEEIDRWTYSKGERKIKIDEIKANGTGWDITFTDENASEYAPELYNIIFRELDQTAYADVEYKNISVVSDTEGVNASSEKNQITLTLEGSEFEDSVNADDITLENAFKDMSIENISVSGNNLTIQLKGAPVRNEELNIQESGLITVASSAIKDGYTAMTVDVKVYTEAVYFDSSSLNCENGKVTADIIVYDSVDVDSLTKDNILIDGLTVEAVEKKDEHRVTITVAADSANDFVEKADGKTMTLNGYETKIMIVQADFYPVFDSCEENGDNLVFTVHAYSISGTFDSGLKAEAFSFGSGLEGAKVESVELESDHVAKLVFSFPSNGQTADELDLTGDITLAANSLVNRWGEKQSNALTNSRTYSNETLGRADKGDLSKETLLDIQKYTRGRNTLLGELCYWGGTAGTVFSIAKTGLEVLGVVESEHSQIMKEFKEINMKLDDIQNTLTKQTIMMEDVSAHLYEQDINVYRKSLGDMMSSYYMLVNMYKNARDDYAPEVYIAGKKLPPKMRQEKTEPKVWLDWENATDEERAAYSNALTDICAKGDEERNPRYENFSAHKKTLGDKFSEVINAITVGNVFQAVDAYASYKYNFDTQAYYYRCTYREEALASLEQVISLLHILYKTDSDPYNNVFSNPQVIRYDFDDYDDYDDTEESNKGLNDKFLEAVEFINKNAVTSLAPEDVDVVVRKVNVKKSVEDIGYIGEVKLSAAEKAEDAKKPLIDEGYTIIEKDLNNGAGGDYVYLGYKKTDNYNDAIKDFQLLTGKGYKDVRTTTINGMEYKACPANYNGDLNHKASGDWIFLYYTKTPQEDNKAIAEIEFNATKSGSVCNKDLNESAGGDDIYMHLTKYAPDETFTVTEERGSNEAYHPYCYALKRKVRIGTSKGNKVYYDWKGVLVSADSQRNPTNDEYAEFNHRLNADTIVGELEDAGIHITLPLITKLSKTSGSESVGGAKNHKTYTYHNMYGDLIYPDDSSITPNVHLSKLYPNSKRHYKNERYQEFTYLYLD